MRYGPFRASVSPLFYLGQWPIYVGGVLVLTQLLGMVLGALTGGGSQNWLSLLLSPLMEGQIWRAVTHWIPVPLSIWTFVSLIFFGFTSFLLENQIGRVRFVGLCLFLILLPVVYGAVLYLSGLSDLISYAGLTASLLHVGVIVACARILPGLPLLFGIPFKYFALVLVVIDLLQFIAQRAWPALGLYLAALVGVCYLLTHWTWLPPLGFIKDLTGRDHWSPTKMKSASLSPFKGRRRGGSSKLSEVRDYQPIDLKQSNVVETLEAPEFEVEEELDVDLILDKISREGIQSLTAQERKFLESASRQMRRKS